MNELRNMRVLQLGRFHHDIPTGGIERHTDSLLTGLAQEIEVDNLVAADGTRAEAIIYNGYRVYRVPCFGKIASTAIAPGLITTARRLVATRHYDIVHFHFPDPLSHLAAQFMPRHIRRIVTWHSDIFRYPLLYRIYRPWLERFLAKVDAVIAPTPANFAAYQQLASVPKERRHVIPFGLDYSRFDDPTLLPLAEHLRRSSAGNAPLILAVGRHVYYKGFEFLLEAMTYLPSAHLVLVGEGPLTAFLRRRASELGIAARTTFTGRLDDRTLAAWYRACDVFCLPSCAPAETFGLVQLEAMACAKPVVSTRLGTGVEFVNVDGETGLIVPPRNAGALATALQRLLDDPSLRATMGEAARQRARSRFSLQAMITQTLDLYRSLLIH